MRVIATQNGFHLTRVRAGKVFEYDLEKYGKKVGDERKLPSWVVEDTPENRAKYQDARAAEADKNFQAAKAAAGPKRAGVTAAKKITDPRDLV